MVDRVSFSLSQRDVFTMAKCKCLMRKSHEKAMALKSVPTTPSSSILLRQLLPPETASVRHSQAASRRTYESSGISGRFAGLR